ncbi:MAG: aspartate aminotransferase [Solirubrobacteraceae bacterium]|jgi:aspartate aminotransferase|nr:aspartate aminotransferase [Solirubrobacteraceae bacterium]
MTASCAAGRIEALVPPSATLAINERIEQRIRDGGDVLHLAFGEAGLPLLPSVAERLARAAPRTGYGSVAGSPEARAAAAGWYERRGLPTAPEQILFAPGSKPLIYALLTVLPGDIVIPQPSWVSYAAHAALAGKRTIKVPIGPIAGGVPDPDALEEHLAQARRDGANPGVLVLTLPDNPTGTQPPGDLVDRVCRIAEQHGLLVVADEIYRDLAHDVDAYRGPADSVPERSFVTNGLSKNMALGGWRIGFARVADGALGDEARTALAGIAGAVWSALAAPMQDVAAYVLAEPDDVREHVARSRAVHRAVATAAHAEVTAAGIDCRPPSGAFYLYPDFEAKRDALAEHGVTTGRELAAYLLERHDVGVLAGEAFGDEPHGLRVRMATSLLYGSNDDERRQALRSDDPTRLPWIRGALDRLRAALDAL